MDKNDIHEIITILENTQGFVNRLSSGNFMHKRANIYANIELALIKLREIDETLSRLHDVTD